MMKFLKNQKKNYLKTNEHEYKQNQWDGAKGILRGKFVAYSRPSSTNKKNLK